KAYFGGCDHQLHCLNLNIEKTLCSPPGLETGHHEWITSLCIAPGVENEVITAGMDGKLCIWKDNESFLKLMSSKSGHSGSISKVISFGFSNALSSGYDKQLKLWKYHKSNLSEAAEFSGHSAPILDIQIMNSSDKSFTNIASISRDGSYLYW